MRDYNNGGETDPTGGSTGGPALRGRLYADIGWTFPVIYEPLLLGFDVVIWSGPSADDSDHYVFPPVRVNPSDRRMVKAFSPNISLSGIHASVRAIYA